MSRNHNDDPFKSLSHREMFTAIQEGKVTMNEFGYWYCYRIADASLEVMREEQARNKCVKRINAADVPA